MKCAKRRYRDEIGAKFALSQVRTKARRDKHERRVYRCPACQGFHLTSKGKP